MAPGSLVEQWQDELYEKFGLNFTIFSRELDQTSRTGNAFEEHNLLVARLDQLSRSEEFREKLESTEWDLVVVDEAHKMSACADREIIAAATDVQIKARNHCIIFHPCSR